MHQQQTAFENIVGKEEIARIKQFLLFPQCFLLNQIIVSPFVPIFDIISFFAAELEDPKIGISALCSVNRKHVCRKHLIEHSVCRSQDDVRLLWTCLHGYRW